MSWDQVVVTEDSHDAGFRRRPMARWAEDGSVAKARGGKGAVFNRCLTSKQIELDLAAIQAATPTSHEHKRTRTREPGQQAHKRGRADTSPSRAPSHVNGFKQSVE
ncbi:hypothetical protein CYMTET_36146 [Cymbomonas tetramitiformis]|uniref:Uncharacterized protein n=1 Tax=Cymbomonas tetramitiformis TaxID=36881 RepID=A0AAE0F798_9CHLO|nr:hypothetical protein CYMTET_36146 [Cymbomonas tetramitiformis]